jgi:hypothetical protein
MRAWQWSADQRDATLRGVGAAASQSNLAAQQTADANSGSMWGSLLQGAGSNPLMAKGVDKMVAAW